MKDADIWTGRARLVQIRAHTATLAANEMLCVVHSVLLMLGKEARLRLEMNGMPSSKASAFKTVIARLLSYHRSNGYHSSHTVLRCSSNYLHIDGPQCLFNYVALRCIISSQEYSYRSGCAFILCGDDG